MISNKKFLLLSLLMAPAAKADCDSNSSCCTQKSSCQVACDMQNTCESEKNMVCENCVDETKSCNAQEENCDIKKTQECASCCESCETKETKTCNESCSTTCNNNPEDCTKSCQISCDKTCEQTANENFECGTKSSDCSSCCSPKNAELEVVKSHHFDTNDNETIEETEEEVTTRLKTTAIIEAEKTFENIFKMLGGISHSYLSMSAHQKTTFAKTLIEFLFNVQKEIKAHSALFEKMGPEYVKACENLNFNFVEASGKSEEENLKDKFTYFVSKISQFYVDFGYIYKNLNLEEQSEIAQIFANIYLEQREVCKENAAVLEQIAQAFTKAAISK